VGRISKYLAIGVLLLGAVALAIGITFIAESVAKNNLVKDRMRTENVTFALEPGGEAKLILSGADAEKLADKIKSDREKTAPTYQDLLAGNKFDPTNATQLKYAQAMNMENYLYTADLAFGLTTVVLASGAFMIVVGIALGVIGIVLFRLPRGSPQVG
jgi:hypothetical protein